MTSAVILGMIVTMFPEPREQAKAIGVYAFVASAGGSIGLLAGGVLTESINWHWIFFVNIPIAIATARAGPAAARARRGHRLRRGRRHPRRGADHELADARRLHDRQAGGRARLGLGPRRSCSAPSRSRCWSPSSSARRGPRNPLIPLRIFRSRNVSGANVVQALLGRRDVRDVLPGSLYMERVLGYDAARDRPRLPAGDARHGDAVAPLLRAADHALRRHARRCSRAWC